MKLIKLGTLIVTLLLVGFLARQPEPVLADLPNRMPEAAPYITAEAAALRTDVHEFSSIARWAISRAASRYEIAPTELGW